MASPPLRLIPLGGLGEIGMNCMVVEVGEHAVVVDAGVTFPSRGRGVDIIHPDFGYLSQRERPLDAILITHAHEDHIGAMPYLLPIVGDVPVYAPPYAIAHIERRLGEFEQTADLRPTRPGQSFGVGPFEVEPVRVNHSIPDATALILRTASGTIVHTGDFKIERDPMDGEAFGSDALRRAGDEGVDLLLSDSTNIDVKGRAGEERDVAGGLESVIVEAPARVCVAIFASNVHRLRAIMDIARRHRKKICLLGRSLDNHAKASRELGVIDSAETLFVAPEEAKRIPRDELILVVTGTQGEAPAALGRIARGDHRHMTLAEGDTVVLSARVIPGHEQSVFDLINSLERQGVTVHHRRTRDGLHVSGHACREEQREMLRLVRPRCFLPVHGTLYHMRQHAELAREEGVENTIYVENGAVLECDAEGLREVGSVGTGRVFRARGRLVERGVLRERGLMAELGIVFAALPLDDEGELLGAPAILTRGIVLGDTEDANALHQKASRFVDAEIDKYDARGEEALVDQTRRSLRRFFKREYGTRPLVAVEVARVDWEES